MPGPQLNEIILKIYQSCRGIPVHDFKDWAMATVRNVVDFDSGLWVTAQNIVSEAFNSVYLFRQPWEMIENYAREIGIADDALAQAAIANPGRTMILHEVVPYDEFITIPMYLKHGRHFGVEHALCTCHISSVSQIPTAISFYRADRNRPFSEEDRQAKEVLVPHMIEAMRINLFASLLGAEGRQGEALAFCDAQGVLYETTSAFTALVAAVRPDWRGPRLDWPSLPLDGVNTTRWSTGDLTFEASPCRDLFLVRAKRENVLDRLSPRQLAVAEMLARGKQYKDIGRALGISPSTVTNHVNQIHERLEIRKREELVELFNSKLH
ncbi:helix-turn-helix transcriptional regulator [Ciceribacter sp. RN22]|uniref:helix-turn-helix transcriptional regulator n=1 Tax=Ciceribacter sp. RN22 TaxID=2954932 RepID=UPI002092633C|nr:helix-turn-helix transcriptional regulator [Ciceribacter sp. RN22]MCO6177607.1 helix-turn-helix transcriptional regulator [Ciceribacter sp. RN22]